MTFTAPHIDYAGLSPVIALTAGICAVLVAGVLSERAASGVVVSALSLTTLGGRGRPVHLAVGRARRTWWPARCGSTSSGSRPR